MRILLVFHIYYENLIEYYLRMIGNIHSCQWDMVVTGNNLSAEVLERIKCVRPDFKYINTPNVGYDIWPFIQCIQASNLDDYDVVIKLHTKKEDDYKVSMHKAMLDGESWKRTLVEPMLGSPKRFSILLEAFKKKSTGIAYSRMVDCICNGKHNEDRRLLTDELDRLHLKRAGDHFCSGTMFAARACALKFLQTDQIRPEMFPGKSQQVSHAGATLAHVYERLIPLVIQGQGYEYVPLYSSTSSRLSFLPQDFIVLNRFGEQRRKYLIICGLKIPVSRGVKPACAEDPIILTAVDDRAMYKECIQINGAVCSDCRLHPLAMENSDATVADLYNAYLETLHYSDDFWIIFCQQNWKTSDNLRFMTESFDKKKIYGVIGFATKKICGKSCRIGKGTMNEAVRPGCESKAIKYLYKKGRVDELGSQCMMIHSSLVTKYGLRFNSNSENDDCVARFCIDAGKFGVKCEVVPVKSIHFTCGKHAKEEI